MWSEELICKKCNRPINIGEYDSSVVCAYCGQKYDTIDNDLYHATACSATSVYYEIDDSWQIKRIHFENQPMDLLDEAVQNTRLLSSLEKRPSILASVVKKYYDALKKRIQLFLTLGNIPILTAQEKEKIAGDMEMYSVTHLIEYLKQAFPSRLIEIERVWSVHEAVIKRMKWVRDKSEHPLMKLWSMPGKIYDDKNEQPNSKNPPKDYLDYNFIIKSNHAVIDICCLLLHLDPTPRDKKQYETLEDLRIK